MKPAAVPIPSPPSRRVGDAALSWLFGSLGTVPMAILAVELIVDLVLLFVGAMFGATVFLLFVTLILFAIAIWLTIGLSTLAAAIALVTLLAALPLAVRDWRRRYWTPGVLAVL